MRSPGLGSTGLCILKDNTYMLLSQLLMPWAAAQDLSTEVTGLSLDSREIKPGYVFFALVGSSQDGRHYVTQAIKAGACAIIVDSQHPLAQSVTVPVIAINQLNTQLGAIAQRFYGYPARSMTLYGVTGTNGKTSITYYLAEALSALNSPTGIVGTTGNGLWPHLQAGTHTTPDPIKLAQLLAQLAAQNAQAVAMEVSSHALDQHRVDGLTFDTAIFTNLTRDHLDYHHTMEAYAQAKARLFDFPGLKFRLFNTDDPQGVLWARCHAADTTYTYGLKAQALLRHTFVSAISSQGEGMQIDIESPWYRGKLHLNLVGDFNVLNILAVFVALCVHDHPPEKVVAALQTIKPPPGRMQWITRVNQPMVVIDYAHTPDALESALSALRAHTEGQLWCVFGCGGDRDVGKRPQMAAIAARYADRVVVTSDNPRSEDPDAIIQAIIQGFSNSNDYQTIVSRIEAIQTALAQAQSQDVILIAGKGHEPYQEIAGVKYPYQDAQVVNDYFNKA